MEATHPASQEKAGYLRCPAYVAQNLGLNRGSRGLFRVLVVLGVAGGRGAWPWPSREEAPPRKRSQARMNPARPWAVPCIVMSCRHLWLLHTVRDGGGGSPRNAETGRVCSGRDPSSAAGVVDSQTRLLVVGDRGVGANPRNPPTPLTDTRPRARAAEQGLAAEPCSVSVGTGGPGGRDRAQ